MDSSQKPRICVSLCEPTVDALERATAAAAELCDLIEVRLDCLDPSELEHKADSITKLLQESKCESIVTFRPSHEGGQRQLDEATRQTFWSDAIYSQSFYDVELDLAEKFTSNETPPFRPIDWSRTICSHHDFAGVPQKLEQIYERMCRTPARILKLAVQANDATDCLPVFALLEQAHGDGRAMIAIAMGESGIATRVLGPSRGSFLTYAALEDGTQTAPGQLSVSELHDVYRIERIDRQTQVFGLIGQPVSHSVSPLIHNAAFAETNANAVYLPFDVHDVEAFLKRMIHPRTRELNWHIGGLSVTAPHKFAVMACLDWIEPAAKEIGAVNTIVVANNELHGYNTDAPGFINSLASAFPDLREARCAVIGTGGAASAALWSLKQAGAATTVFARDTTKASSLAARFDVEWQSLADASFAGFDLVVNATPLGMTGSLSAETPATASQLRGAWLAYDLVYNPTETRFLREGLAAGCKTMGGFAMLVAQGVEQFKLWTGMPAPEKVMREAAMSGL
jgi:3-dehydroquinate dehydratase/shikimate dehydrogenase